MNNDNRTIAFISGKGGSGKTTVCISIAKLLSELNLKCLLLDFDFATNGMSYFFQNFYKKANKGILNVQENMDITAISITDKLDIIPSNTSFNEDVKNEIDYNSLHYILSNFEKEYDYIFIDLSAGYNTATLTILKYVDCSVFVSEADSISSDATENLMIRLGNNLPHNKKSLINKIDARDSKTYNEMKYTFQKLNKLPPLPFDFSIRQAFGARQIPIDIKKPNHLLIALLDVIVELFPERYNFIQDIKNKRLRNVFEKYESELNLLNERRQSLEENLEKISFKKEAQKSSSLNIAIMTIGIIGTLFSLLSIYVTRFSDFWGYYMKEYFPSIMIGVLGVSTFIYSYWNISISRRRFNEKMDELEMKKEVEAISSKITEFKSASMARSKDFFLEQVNDNLNL